MLAVTAGAFLLVTSRSRANGRKTPSAPRQPDDHNFGSLLMLAVTAGAFLLIT
jgi:hypothetical protein